jgi:hypothetical protein
MKNMGANMADDKTPVLIEDRESFEVPKCHFKI